MQVKFNNLSAAYLQQKSEIDLAIQNVFEKSDFILGKAVSIFEQQFAEYNNAKYCCSCDNGTNAIEIGLKALGIGKWDSVLVPCNTFAADTMAVEAVGAEIILYDVNEETMLADETFVNRIRDNTKAIIFVNLFGQRVPDKLFRLAEKHQLFQIEDSAQSHGAASNGSKSSRGDVTTFSFYPGKNLGCGGDGGGMVTNNVELYNKMIKLRNYGSSVKYYHDLSNSKNSRLDSIHAATLSIKLKKLDEWNERRNQMASLYTELLKDVGDIKTPVTLEGDYHVFHLYIIRTEKRNELQAYLTEKGIQTGIHYPIPLHRQKCYPDMNNLSFPVTEKLSDTILSLPMHPFLKIEEVEYVVDKIHEFFSK